MPNNEGIISDKFRSNVLSDPTLDPIGRHSVGFFSKKKSASVGVGQLSVDAIRR